MKEELIKDFGVRSDVVTVISHPANNAFPDTDLTPIEAKRRLGIANGERTLLFLGRIRPYKGLEYLLSAFEQLVTAEPTFRLIVAGEPKKGNEEYLAEIYETMRLGKGRHNIILKDQFIKDEDIELYLKAADVLVLPYKDISQSGILFLAYTFGLPVIASDVGSFRESIVEGRTGFVFKPQDTADLVRAIDRYFASDLFRDLSVGRQQIREHVKRHHSWHAVGQATRQAYEGLMRQ